MVSAESARAQLARKRAAIARTRAELVESLGIAIGALDEWAERDSVRREALRERMDQMAGANPWRFLGWDADVWTSGGAVPTPSEPPPEVRVGAFPALGGVAATVPVFDGRAVVVTSDSREAARPARELLRSIAVRLSAELGPHIVLHLIDPQHGGFGFPERAHLRNDAPPTGDAALDISAAIEAGRAFSRDFEGVPRRSLPDDRRLASPVHAVIALDFPHGYGYEAVARLTELARLAPAGIQLILHHDLSAGDAGAELVLESPWVLEVQANGLATGPWGMHRATVDPAPPDSLVKSLPAPAYQSGPATAPEVAPAARRPRWADLDVPGDRWRGSAATLATARVGVYDDGDPLELRFGADESTGAWHGHVAIAGTTGTGKSFLAHAVILSLATRYRPDELRLYVFDGQDGVTSQSYVDLPHADVVSMHTPEDLLRGVIVDIASELTRRNILATSVGVDSIARYWEVSGGVNGMPRLVVVIEEYQALLASDRRGDIEATLREITSMGRKFGVHLVLLSQRFGASGLVSARSLFANIDTRVAMRVSDDEAQAAPFGPQGRALIAGLGGPNPQMGRVVVNDALGADPGSRVGTVASFGPPEGALREVRRIVESVARLAAERGMDSRPVVLNGQISPRPADSRQLQALAALAAATHNAAPDEIQRRVAAWAKTPSFEGGADFAEWPSYRRPVPMCLGRGFNLYGAVIARLDREVNQNVLLVGASPAVATATIATAVVSMAWASAPGSLDVVVVSAAPRGGSWDDVLGTGIRSILVRRGHRWAEAADAEAALRLLQTAVAELDRRIALSAEEVSALGPYLVVGQELDRVAAVRAPESERYSTEPPLDPLLARILREGPEVGVHAVLGFSTVTALRRVVPTARKLLRLFSHKVVGQLSVEDSRELLADDFAASVSAVGNVGPARLGYRDDVNESARQVALAYSTETDLVESLEALDVNGTESA